MAQEWKYSEDGKKVILTNGEPKSKLKVTGTRLGSILGLNPWSTPFQMWCEITKLAKKPFIGNMFTQAGIAIEPKQIAYTQSVISENIKSPEDFFGNRYSQVKYDFYPDNKIFGGMWDSKLVLPSGKVNDIFEYKTTKRAEDWLNQVPVYYLIQVLEYAYLEEARRAHLVVSFLKDEDYNHPDDFKVTDDNTQIFTYNVEDTYININDGSISYEKVTNDYFNIEELIGIANTWYNNHIKKGISPKFDEKKDKDYLDIIRTSAPQNDLNNDDLVAKANALIDKIDTIKKENKLDILEKELKACEDGIKKELSSQMSENDTKIVLANYVLSRTVKEVTSYNSEQMELDGVLNKYIIKESKETLTLRKTKKEDK